GARVPLTLKRLLQLATIDGAADLGIADRTGSVTPGKRADVVLVRTTDANMAPSGDPYEAIVSFGLPANVDTVIVDGRVLRRAGTFTAFDHPQIVAEARAAAIALRDKAGWPTCALTAYPLFRHNRGREIGSNKCRDRKDRQGVQCGPSHGPRSRPPEWRRHRAHGEPRTRVAER